MKTDSQGEWANCAVLTYSNTRNEIYYFMQSRSGAGTSCRVDPRLALGFRILGQTSNRQNGSREDCFAASCFSVSREKALVASGSLAGS
jgi:hypothetical protein